jgi:PPOX class probable F420-dependent enzyme
MSSSADMNLLPLVPEPFTCPTDREMLPSERREFVRTHRTCVFGTPRRHDGPAMSVVYYIPTDTDELLVSTMRDRGKAKAVSRNPKASLCVLDERWPFSYLQVYCDAVVDDDPDVVVDVMMAVAERMSGESLPDEVRPVVAKMAEDEGRVVLRCRPYSTFAQPPAHLYRNDQDEGIVHWVSAVVPWDTADKPSSSHTV